jgi:predicted permease
MPIPFRAAARRAGHERATTGITLVCLVLAFSLTIVASCAIYAIFIQPLPYYQADELFIVNVTRKRSGTQPTPVTLREFEEWQRRAGSIASLAGLQFTNFTLNDKTSSDRYTGAAISHGLFGLLGKIPQIGRDFTALDDREGAEPVAIISDDLWRHRFGGDSGIIGRAVSINSRTRTIIGVMPPGFRFPQNQYLWLPLAEFIRVPSQGSNAIQLVGRLQQDVSIDDARRQANLIAAAITIDLTGDREPRGAYIRSIREWTLPASSRQLVLMASAATMVVLLVACLNAAYLQFARISTRLGDISLMHALGAPAAGISVYVLMDSVLLVLTSLPASALLAWLWVEIARVSIPTDVVPYVFQWKVNAPGTATGLLLCALTAVGCSLAPAVRATVNRSAIALNVGARVRRGGVRRLSVQNVLVVVEVASTVAVLVVASLLIRSLLNRHAADAGFDTAPLLTMRVLLPEEPYSTAESRTGRVNDIVTRLEGLPAVQSVFASNMVPFGSAGRRTRILIDGRTFAPGDTADIQYVGVTAHIFRTLAVSIVQGRGFTESEASQRSGLAIINEAMARTFWSGDTSLGRRFQTVEGGGDWFTIIGVAPTVTHGDFEISPRPCAYVPFPYSALSNTGFTMRVAGDPAQITAAARQQVRESDPSIPTIQVSTIAELQQRTNWPDSVLSWLFVLCGALSLLLAGVGLYGVLSFVVTARTQEIGVRVALGATPSEISRLIAGQAVQLSIVGIASGLAVSVAATRLVKARLFEVGPNDALSYGAAVVIVVTGAAAAGYGPVRRAIRIEPLDAIRDA